MHSEVILAKRTAVSHRFLGLITAGAIFLGAHSLMASLTFIDVDFNGNSIGTAYGGGGPAVGPNQVGAALLGNISDQWNSITDSMLTFSAYPNGGSASGLALTNVDGSASGVTMSLTTQNTFNSIEPNWTSTNGFVTAASPYANLMQDTLVAPNGTPQTVTLSGLGANQMFDLVLYSAGNAAGRQSSFTVNGITKTSTYDLVTSTLVDGVSYVRYDTATSDASGSLVITYFSSVGGGEGNLNGFQLQAPTPVPEPSTYAIAVVGGLALLIFRRIRHDGARQA